jgi:hypothetical protein
MEVMDKIANSSTMSTEMMDAMLNNSNGKRNDHANPGSNGKDGEGLPVMIQMIKSDDLESNREEAVICQACGWL